MLCEKCGKQINDGTNICSECKMNLTQQSLNDVQIQNSNSEQTTAVNQSLEENNQNKNRKFLLFIIIIVILLLILIIWFLFFRNNESSSDKKDNNIDNDVNTIVNNECFERVVNYNPNYDETGSFLMYVNNVFATFGNDAIATGTIKRGKVSVGDTVQVIGLNMETITTKVSEITQNNSSLNSAKIGDNIAIVLQGVSKDELTFERAIIAPNSMTGVITFEAEIYLLSNEQGGVKDAILDNTRFKYVFDEFASTGGILNLPDGMDKINPGNCANVVINLENDVAMEVGSSFSIVLPGKSLGVGIVTKIDVNNTSDNKFTSYEDKYDIRDSFSMTVEDIYGSDDVSIKGSVESGIVGYGDTIVLTFDNNKTITTTVSDVSVNFKSYEYAKKGDTVKLTLSNVTRDQLDKIGTIKNVTKP